MLGAEERCAFDVRSSACAISAAVSVVGHREAELSGTLCTCWSF